MGDAFWMNVLTSSVALIILLAIILLIYYVINYRGLKKRKEHFSDLHQNLKIGQKVVLGNGIYGRLTSVNGDTVDLKVKSGAVMEISRYSISKIIE